MTALSVPDIGLPDGGDLSAGRIGFPSVFGLAAYLRASADHEHADLLEVRADGARLVLLDRHDGVLCTVYGLARPDGAPTAVPALAEAVMARPESLSLVLSPFGEGVRFAAACVEAGATVTERRPVAFLELDGADPAGALHPRNRRAIAVASRRGAEVEIAPLAPWFGAFYRRAMEGIGAAAVYHFADGYFSTLASLDHFVASVRDADGVAAAALFLASGEEVVYHLAGRRGTPAPVYGAMNLALAEGIRHAWRQGRRIIVLGGGRSPAPDDALLAFKLQFGARTAHRQTLVRAGRCES